MLQTSADGFRRRKIGKLLEIKEILLENEVFLGPVPRSSLRKTLLSGRFAAITKTEVAANRYRDFGRDNSLQGLMLKHRPMRIVSSKACGFCRALRHETPYGVTK